MMMLRRDVQQFALRIAARVLSGAQCSTSSTVVVTPLLENTWLQTSAVHGLRFHQTSTPISSSLIVDLRASSRSLATAAPSQLSEGLSISEAAVSRLKQLQQSSGTRPLFLRLTVEGGGCSGFQYEFALEEEGPKKGDQVFAVGGATVLCDDVSLQFLNGATIDFESDLMRSAFVVSLLFFYLFFY